MKIEYYKHICNTPALALAIKGWMDLRAHKLCDEGQIFVAWDNESIVSFMGPAPVAVMTFAHQEWSNNLTILLGYCEPEFRGKGYYHALWDKIVEIAQERNCTRITTASHPDNYRSIKIQQARSPRSVRPGPMSLILFTHEVPQPCKS